jgi:hypothetical protein
MGWRAIRSGDYGEAVSRLATSIHTSLHDIRQPLMLAAAFALRCPFAPRELLLKAVKK